MASPISADTTSHSIRDPLSPNPPPPSTPPSIPRHPHSVQSSLGRLSLHDYRKLQSSPVSAPSSTAAGKTLKRKGKASNLSTASRIPAPRPRRPQRQSSCPNTSHLTQSPSPPATPLYTKSTQFSHEFGPPLHRPRLRVNPARQSELKRYGRLDLEDHFLVSSSWIPDFPTPPLTPTPLFASDQSHSQKVSRSNTYPYRHHQSSSDPFPYRRRRPFTVHHQGVSFEILNPHDSLELLRLTSPEGPLARVPDQINERRHSSASLHAMARRFSSNNPYLGSEPLGQSQDEGHSSYSRTAPLFQDYPEAYEAIQGRISSAKLPMSPPGIVDPENPFGHLRGLIDLPGTPAHLIRPGPLEAQPAYRNNPDFMGIPYALRVAGRPPTMIGPGHEATEPVTEGNREPSKLRKQPRRPSLKIEGGPSGDFDESITPSKSSPGLLGRLSTQKLSRMLTSRSFMSKGESSRSSPGPLPQRPLSDVTNESSKDVKKSQLKQKSPMKINKRRTPGDHSTVSNIIASYKNSPRTSVAANDKSEKQEDSLSITSRYSQVQPETSEYHISGLSQFDFGVFPIPEKPGELSLYETAGPSGEPPNVPLPPLPTAGGYVDAEGNPVSLASSPPNSMYESYGNTRNLLGGIPQSDVRMSYKDAQGTPQSRMLTLQEALSLEDEIRGNIRHFGEPSEISWEDEDGIALVPTGLGPGKTQSSSSRGFINSSGNIKEEQNIHRDEATFVAPHVDMGPGAAQSSSSHGLLSSSGDFQQEQVIAEETPKSQRLSTALDKHRQNRLALDMIPKNVTFSKKTPQIMGHSDLDDDEWETVGESQQQVSEHIGRLRRGDTGSSLANYSSYGSLRNEATSWSPLADARQVPRHPAISSYEHTQRLVNDLRSGLPVLVPSYRYTSGGFPDQNSLVEPVPAGEVTRNYQHPTPLAAGRRDPYTSVPTYFLGREGRRRHRRGTNTAMNVMLPAQTYQPGSRTRKSTDLIKGQSNLMRGDDQQEVESLTRPPVVADSSYLNQSSFQQPRPEGSFNKVTTLGVNKNVTGSFNGTGMRVAGSSLADNTSTGIDFSSPPTTTFPLRKPARDAKRVRFGGLPSPTLPFTLSSPRTKTVRFPEEHYPKATPGVIHQELCSQREELAKQGKLSTLQTSTLDPRLVPVYGAPLPRVQNSDTNLIPLERSSLTLSPRPPRQDKKTNRMFRTATPSNEAIRARIAEIDAIEMVDMASSRQGFNSGILTYGGLEPSVGGRSTADSRVDEENRWWDVTPSPHLQPRDRDAYLEGNIVIQKKIGRRIIWTCVAIPIPGWFVLCIIAFTLYQSSDIISLFTGGRVTLFGRKEIKLARIMLAVIGVIFVVVCMLSFGLGFGLGGS